MQSLCFWAPGLLRSSAVNAQPGGELRVMSHSRRAKYVMLSEFRGVGINCNRQNVTLPVRAEANLRKIKNSEFSTTGNSFRKKTSIGILRKSAKTEICG